MMLLKIHLIILLLISPLYSNAQTKKSKQKSFLNQKFSELSYSYSLMSDKIALKDSLVRGIVRLQMQGLNFTYTNLSPNKSGNLIYTYGFGAGIGIANGLAKPFAEEVNNIPWFTFFFIPGIDFRNSFRTRIGVFAPISYRNIGFNFDQPITLISEDPLSVGLGFRYINAISLRSSITFAFSHQILWKATNWDFSWQYRL